MSDRKDPSRRWARFSWAHLLFLGMALLLSILAFRMTVHPPSERINEMDAAFQEMRAKRASLFAEDLALDAEAAREVAVSELRAENGRWFLLRDYSRADSLAGSAAALAHAAASRATAVSDSLQFEIESGLPALEIRIEDTAVQLDRLTHLPSARSNLTEGRTNLALARARLDRGDIVGSFTAFRAASAALDRAGSNFGQVVNNYLKHLPDWVRWVDDTIKWSADHRATAIVVDKMARRCVVYSSGKQVASFPVEFGPQWLGPKTHAGDLSTPEGLYRVTRKRGPGETIYHLALEINYPNDFDRRRFDTAKANGEIPAGAGLGGNIELHGEGGRAFDWTRGCVALHNDDMRIVYDLSAVGTPVTIVGATENPFEATSSQ